MLSQSYLKLYPGYLATKTFARESFYMSFTHICSRFPLLTHPVLLGAGCDVAHAAFYDMHAFAIWFNFSTTF